MRRFALLLSAALALPAAAAEVVSVEQLDITRYAGQWHEIARLPMFFQRNCVGVSTAQYTLRDDGMVGVHNSCRTEDGETDTVEGVARRDKTHPGRLEVRFAPDWLSWLPLTWADYWVIAIDPDYQWAVVGEPGHDYLWILSRTPEMSRARFDEIKTLTTAMGYDLEALIVSAPAESLCAAGARTAARGRRARLWLQRPMTRQRARTRADIRSRTVSR